MSRDAVQILVVDDNRDAAESLGVLLQLRNYQCRVAYDGLSALSAALDQPPDCLISDISMPGLDGYALARRVRAEPALAGIKLVALSAFSGDGYTREAAEAGFDYCVTKGTDSTALFEVLRMIEEIKDLAAKTQDLTRQNIDLAGQTKELLQEVKEEIKGVREDVKEVKQNVQDLKDELKELKGDQGPE